MIVRRLGTLLFAAAACAMPGPALAQYYPGEGPIYHTYYFSDTGHTMVVGIYHGDCAYTGPLYHTYLEGETSANSEDVYVGYCYHGYWQPI